MTYIIVWNILLTIAIAWTWYVLGKTGVWIETLKKSHLGMLDNINERLENIEDGEK